MTRPKMPEYVEVWRRSGRQLVTLVEPQVKIGRDGSNDIVLADDATVSRLHAVLSNYGDGWCVRDLGARNGTLVNGERLVGERVLRPGDELRCGTSRLIYRGDRAAAEAERERGAVGGAVRGEGSQRRRGGDARSVGLITDRPEHPVVSGVVAQLRERGHSVRLLDGQGGAATAVAERELRDPAQTYLLWKHEPGNVELARRLERAGALVINRLAAADVCLDRFAMTEGLSAAGLPQPKTWVAADLKSCLAGAGCPRPLPYPVVVKSRWAGSKDLVCRVTSEAQLEALAVERPQDSVIVQVCVPNDGLDRKLYVIDDRVFALWRTSPLPGDDSEDAAMRVQGSRPDLPRVPIEAKDRWVKLARAVGRAFGLRVYGVDILVSESGPSIVDVNSFPGMRGIHGAAESLVAMIERLAATRTRAG